MVYDSLEPIDRPTKLMKLDDGRSNAFSVGSSNASNTNGSGLPQVFGAGSLPVNQVMKAEGQNSEKQLSQVRVPVSTCQLSYWYIFEWLAYIHASAGLCYQLDTVVS